MADLDAELLALAGGDDSSDEESPASPEGKQASPMEALAEDGEEEEGGAEEEGELDDSGEKESRKAGKQSARSKKSRNDGDDAALSSSPRSRSRSSLRSASMSESDSESSPPPDDNQEPIFPYEKLYYSAKDKAEVEAMPEIQREELLSERVEQVERRNQDLALHRLHRLHRLLATREREGAGKNKRKASDEDVRAHPRASSRKKRTLGGREVGETSDAIEAYKRQREQRGKREEQRRRDASARKKDGVPSSPDDGEVSDREGHAESDVEWEDRRRHRSPSAPKDDPPAELRDIQRACVGRSNFAQVCFYPGFDQAISNCYARVMIGVNKDTGSNEYRMCLIKKFTEGRPYAMEGPNGRSFITSQYAVLAHGKAEKEFPFIAISDSPFTEAEFNRYRQTMIVEDCKMATKSTVANKVVDINKLINHNFTKEELDEKLRRQGVGDSKKIIYERIQLDRRRGDALAAGDEATVAECDAELARLKGPKLAFGTMLVKPRSTEKTQQQRLADLNKRNDWLNTQNVKRAQLDERKAKREAAMAVARGEAVADRFARVITRARIHHDVSGNKLLPKGAVGSGSEISGPVTPITGANTPIKQVTPNRGATPSSSAPKEESKLRKGVPVIRHRPTDDENIAALDLHIDIDV
ncbi:hypothetical protein AJ80_10041 [Polytolypa hystricis UAMH7299]|uniref:Plus3 domain-containing protein n=1 Tax=Polytolypa hystricis (strain UAMH7299) TaxID=1447883 RepID=A0A2B7WEL9_POLH7|nr:hypothetical protein AJ80_10041 [Polytolypa hystricis UAMH7299]